MKRKITDWASVVAILAIIALMLAAVKVKAQRNDSLAVEYKLNINNSKRNFLASNAAFNQGCFFVFCGLGIDLLTNMNAYSLRPDQRNKFVIVGSVLQMVGVGMIFYSHSFVNKGTVKISPTKISYNFK